MTHEACETIVLQIIVVLIRGIVADRAELAAENLALRQQLAALKHKSKRPPLRKRGPGRSGIACIAMLVGIGFTDGAWAPSSEWPPSLVTGSARR